jgi:hypothetical protein
VLDDVLDGYITADHARAQYGVAISPDGRSIDAAATAALRNS